jgi:hypothetical protein
MRNGVDQAALTQDADRLPYEPRLSPYSCIRVCSNGIVRPTRSSWWLAVRLVTGRAE